MQMPDNNCGLTKINAEYQIHHREREVGVLWSLCYSIMGAPEKECREIKPSSKNHLKAIPRDILKVIFKKLNKKTHLNLFYVCKDLRALLYQDIALSALARKGCRKIHEKLNQLEIPIQSIQAIENKIYILLSIAICSLNSNRPVAVRLRLAIESLKFRVSNYDHLHRGITLLDNLMMSTTDDRDLITITNLKDLFATFIDDAPRKLLDDRSEAITSDLRRRINFIKDKCIEIQLVESGAIQDASKIKKLFDDLEETCFDAETPSKSDPWL